MKKLFFTLMLLFTAAMVFAQGGEPVSFDLTASLATFSAASALTLLLTGWIKTALKVTGKYARWLSWAVAIVLAIVGWFLKIGMFEGLQWYIAIVYGFGIGLVSNGIFSSDTVKLILSVVGAQLSKNK